MSALITKSPLDKIVTIGSFLDVPLCEEIITKSEKYGKWTKNRHAFYPTTDIPVEEIPGLSFIREEFLPKISNLAKTYYGLEAQATIKPFDLFVVKYEVGGQDHLALHRDKSEISFVILLSDAKDFDGGGTFYETKNKTVSPEQGGLVMHCGQVRHAGKKITRGTRYILIGFLDVHSKYIGKLQDGEAKFHASTSDRRHLDFLWRGGMDSQDHRVKLSIKIINLKRRPEKLEHIKKTLSYLAIPETVRIDIDVVIANDGKNANDGISDLTAYPLWKIDNPELAGHRRNKFWNRNITEGEIGCFMSHTTTISKWCADSPRHYLLIIEDDATFASDLLYRINDVLLELKDADLCWDAIDFGGISVDDNLKNMESNKDTKITYSLVEKRCTYQTHCIMYSQQGVNKIKSKKWNRNIIPFDEFLSGIRNVHSRSDINKLCLIESNFILYNYYMQLSTQLPTGIHDTEPPSSIVQMPLESMRETVEDDFDMKNYYKFRDIPVSLESIRDLCYRANKSMWQFTLSRIVGSFDEQNISNWMLPVNKRRKLTVILVRKDGELFLHQDEESVLSVATNDLVVFPSYILFKCKKCSIFHAEGQTFL